MTDVHRQDQKGGTEAPTNRKTERPFGQARTPGESIRKVLAKVQGGAEGATDSADTKGPLAPPYRDSLTHEMYQTEELPGQANYTGPQTEPPANE